MSIFYTLPNPMDIVKKCPEFKGFTPLFSSSATALQKPRKALMAVVLEASPQKELTLREGAAEKTLETAIFRVVARNYAANFTVFSGLSATV